MYKKRFYFNLDVRSRLKFLLKKISSSKTVSPAFRREKFEKLYLSLLYFISFIYYILKNKINNRITELFFY